MDWQYLVVAILLSFFGTFFWVYNAIDASSEFVSIIVLLAFIQGFLAFFFMNEKGDPRLIFYSLVFSFSTYFLGKYLLYVHYYDWVISGVVDKDELSYSLLFFYFKAIDMASVEAFLSHYKTTFAVFEGLILLLLTLPTGQYLLLWKNDKSELLEGNPQDKNRRIRRRFTGQQF
jgi:heme/copper-type cytochrome/quinol oxidase subunit 4